MALIPIELDCEEVWRHISEYIDDEVGADLRASMEIHFKGCAHCTAVLDGTRNVVQLIGDGQALELPERLSQRLYTKLNHHLSTKKSGNHPAS